MAQESCWQRNLHQQSSSFTTQSIPLILQAKQLEVDDENAPILPPDFIHGVQFHSVDDARRKYKELRQVHRRKLNQYVSGSLHKELFENKFHVLDHSILGDFDIAIEYVPFGGKKKKRKGEPLPTCTTWVKVRSARSNKVYLRSLLAVDTLLVRSKGSVRLNRGDSGRMWAMGVKNRGKMTMNTKLYKGTDHVLLRDKKIEEVFSPFLPFMNYYMSEFFGNAFPREFEQVSTGNNDMKVDEHTGGDGSLHTFMISRDLGNASHVDRNDKSISICTWVEERPGRAENWFLVFQNTSLCDHPSKAIVIKLSHGLTVSWDGRVLHHCTSLTNVGRNNHVYGNFTSVSKEKTLG